MTWVGIMSGLVNKILEIARRFNRLLRYFGVGIINSVVGYGLYAALVAIFKHIYIAQLVAHVLGMIFNYVMLRAHVFRGATPSVRRYIAAYGVNYLLGVLFLFGFHHIVPSAYIAGFLALVAVAVINYFVLKAFVFRTAQP